MAWLIAATALVVVATWLAVVASGPQFTQVSANPSVSIETNDLRAGEVRFFTYRDREGDQIRFLLARDAIGRIKGAFDACQRCYIYHKLRQFSRRSHLQILRQPIQVGSNGIRARIVRPYETPIAGD
jgi:hypothetical protein